MACDISVIVPIYKVERYLERALDSLLAQSHKNWEAILIDDGSPDSCGVIADEYAKLDNRFKVIHKRNDGVSEARNDGMKKACGKYLLYLDPDDFFHPQLIEICFNTAEKEEADMVVFTYHHYYRTINKIRHFLHLPDSKPSYKRYGDINYVKTDNIFDYATEYAHPKDIDRRWAVKHCQAWRCMYRTEVIRGIRFINGIIFEDFPWWSEVLLAVGKCVILNLPLYYYYPNPKSFLLSSDVSNLADHLEKSIVASVKIYEKAPAEKREIWEKRFLAPFQHYLEKKRKKLKNRG